VTVADVRGLRAIRYGRDLEAVLAPPYDVLDQDQVDGFKARSSHNVVHLTRPGRDYEGAAATLRGWLDEGSWAPEPEPVMMIHETTFDGRQRTDLIAALRLQHYEDGVILPHERTHRGPKEDRLALLRATGMCLEPLWFLYRDLPRLLEGAPRVEEIRFQFEGEAHRLSTIRDRGFMAQVTKAFEGRPLLIADGHHRYETTLAYADEIGGGDDASSRFTLAALTDLTDPGLVVQPTHRILNSGIAVRGGRPVAGLDAALEALQQGAATVVYRDGVFEAYELEGAVPVMELHRQLLDNILGQRAAEDALQYTRDAREAVRWVDEGRGVAAFLLAAPDLGAILSLAQKGETMPQKATYFYPKTPSGLAFHQLDPNRNI